jgi:hypothetical protein
MSNLENFNNMYINLSESAYNGRLNPFPKYQNETREIDFDFSKNIKDKKGEITVSGGKNFPNNGKVYLQLDPTVKTIKEQRTIPFSTTETPQTYTYSYQKELLTGEKAA